MLHLPMEGVGRLFVRVIVATISRMMTQQRELALKYLFQPLIKPLRGLCGGNAYMTLCILCACETWR